MPPSSNAFVPSVVGLICASYVVNDVLKDIPFVALKTKGDDSFESHNFQRKASVTTP